ncbi:uncharacterized protein PHALS_14711 [Plasmopara halstedii]|uniref:Uncharacterized protein n=1 Tax=Plasmopara halstedii TaxID=4781 RepID=A0A0P1APW7_PLAHL|nr:uncharacterized protein PHALS_14711 [Plasmopara halstedii]CEG43477.1 hypothetical protein PHALS_14711 [Plasmopara halstedii]|eukprot:XP_024579846.1 hypothetical protein PHALS_14711 [Plasmopara halstedii]
MWMTTVIRWIFTPSTLVASFPLTSCLISKILRKLRTSNNGDQTSFTHMRPLCARNPSTSGQDALTKLPHFKLLKLYKVVFVK